MSTYYLAPSLVHLRDEINAMFPKRDKTSDGWIGDASHQARPSDHNPDWSAGGVVRAIDVDVDDNDSSKDLVKTVLKATIGDPRVWYVIHAGKIYSRTYGWEAREYTGTNRHDHHIHISIRHTKAAETDTSKWIGSTVRTTQPTIDLSNVRAEFRKAAGLEPGKPKALLGVRRIQRMLNERYKAGLKVDGIAGKATLRAWAIHERDTVGMSRERIPDRKSLAALVRGRYAIVK